MARALKKKPEWIRNSGLISVGFWEPLYFLKYRGGQSTELEAEYERAHGDESLDALAEAGVNLVWTHYFKGFGLEFEAEEMERTRDYIERAHQRGLKVAAYVTLGSLTPETLLQEEPDAINWFQVNQDGQYPSCQTSYQSFRVRPCYHSEGYLRYMERVCGKAIDAGADMIHFDNIGFNAEPDTCHGPLSVAAFREFLNDQYGPQDERSRSAGEARFGHSNFTHVRPPVFNRWNQAINQRHVSVPHQQEWVRFKVYSLTQALERLSHFISKKNPECAVEANLFKAFGENTDYLHGINYDEQLPLLDYAFSEEPHKPGLKNSLGAYLSRARTFKTARAFDVAVQVYNTGATDKLYETSLAENLALNAKGMGHFGHPLQGPFAPGGESASRAAITAKYVSFYRQHRQELLLNTRSLATVGVPRDTASLAFNSLETHHAQLDVEQTLLEHAVPFDLLYPSQMDDLSRYKALVLANTECLSDAAVDRLTQYVEGGGGLLIAQESGAYDQWRRKRPALPWARLLGPEFPGATRARFGQGRVAYLPKLIHKAQPSTSPEVWYIFSQYWAPLANAEAFLSELHYVAGPLPWTLSHGLGAPLAEGLAAPNGARLLHVVNLNQDDPLTDVEASMQVDQPPSAVRALAPGEEIATLAFEVEEDGKRVRFRLPRVERYVLFVVQ